MYATKLQLNDFKCFGKATLALQYPRAVQSEKLKLPNVNVIVGDNGGGKSSILRAIAIAAIAPALSFSGFVPYRLVRRPKAKEARVEINAFLEKDERENYDDSPNARLFATLLRGKGSVDFLSANDEYPSINEWRSFSSDYSSSFFIAGYGATRRVETGDYSESSARKSRGARYQRVASLFEDHVALRPLHLSLRRASRADRVRIIAQINKCLPSNIRLLNKIDRKEEQYLFQFNNTETPFSSLSDGYKAFVGWIGELTVNLCTVMTGLYHRNIQDVPGIVLVDEIDLHLHPHWQQHVLPTIAKAFPQLQFILTTHSPLVISTVQNENIFVTDLAEDGSATVKQIGESAYGRGIEQILLSSYFGLTSTRPDGFRAEAQELFQKAAGGDTEAAITYLRKLGAPIVSPGSKVAPSPAKQVSKSAAKQSIRGKGKARIKSKK